MKHSLNSSYFYGIDNIFGWGNRSYFSYFSEFNRPWAGMGILEAIILGFIFIISLVTNVIMIVRVIRLPQLKTVTNCLLANLAVADTLITTGCPIIAIIRVTRTWILGEFICSMLVFLEIVCMLAIIWTMAVISIDRFICIVKPTSCRITVKMVLVIILLIWIFSLGFSSPLGIYFFVKSFSYGDTTIKICTLIWPTGETIKISIVFVALLFFFGFFLPLSIMTYNYHKVFQTFWESKKTFDRNESRSKQSVSDIFVSWNLPSGIKRNMRSYRVLRVLVLLVLLFFFMWLPLFVAFIGIQRDGMKKNFKMHSWMLFTCSLFAFGNACINPFIYVFINERFRLNFWWCRKNNEQKFPTEENGFLTLSVP